MFNFLKRRALEAPSASVAHAIPVVQVQDDSIYNFADGTTLELLLPRLCGSRQAAALLVEKVKVHLAPGKIVQLNARLTTVGTEAYADELVTLLAKADVQRLLVTPAPIEFERTLLAAGRKHALAVELVG